MNWIEQLVILPLKTIYYFFFNTKEKIFPSLSAQDIDLIKSNDLFDHLDPEHFKELLHAIRKIRYPAGKLIFREGEQGDALYIIADGSVRVYTYDSFGKKVALARLNQGDYFGEQALLGQLNRTRNANTETILDTCLFRISEKNINHILQMDTPLNKTLKKKGYAQALHALSLSAAAYNDIFSFMQKIPEADVIEFKKDDLIFSLGDKPDNIYFILHGSVKLLLPNPDTGKISYTLLNKGHLFGELGVLNNKPRSASAVAFTDLRLAAISGEYFKKHLSQHPELMKILGALHQLYQLPSKGTVEQFIGKTKTLDEVITNIYKMEDGRSIISTKAINQDIFTMLTVNVAETTNYQHERGLNKIEISAHDNNIIGIKANGVWDDLPLMCGLLLDKKNIEPSLLSYFELHGELKLELPKKSKDETICFCMAVTRKTLQEYIDNGVSDLASLSAKTGACTACRGCQYRILGLLGQNPWIPCIMKKEASHNPYINSYILTPTTTPFHELQPGQHVILQVRIGEILVERTYTVSEIRNNGELRITVKKEPKGFFSRWLHEEISNELTINVTNPQGNFILNTDLSSEAICFAGGIGITPFFAFANFLSQAKLPKKMHLLYSAKTKEDFIFSHEFNEIAKQLPSFTIDYKTTNTEGHLSEEEILKKVRSFKEPDVYICGPKGFIRLIRDTLQKNDYTQNKIHIEEFLHAGAPREEASE